MHPAVRHILGGVAGAALAVLLCTMWYVATWIWNQWGWPLFVRLFADPECNSRFCWDGKSFNLVALLPIGIGALLLHAGIAWGKAIAESKWRTYLHSTTLGWAAAIVGAMWSILTGALLLLFAYHLSGFAALLSAAFGLGYIIIPPWAAINAARPT